MTTSIQNHINGRLSLRAPQAIGCFPNLSLKKIPKMVLARCEWGHDDYSLNVANLPMAEPECLSENPSTGKAKQGKRLPENTQGGLFEGDGDE